MVNLYRNKWTRSSFAALCSYLRDSILFLLPMRKTPDHLLAMLGIKRPDFVFLVHPRSYADIFIALPFLSFLKFIFRKNLAIKALHKLPPFILNKISLPNGLVGYVMGQTTCPEYMLRYHKNSLNSLKTMITFASKISNDGVVVGLGGWWPMISKRGAAIESMAKQIQVNLTNGHCGTLASIVMTIQKIAQASSTSANTLTVAVIGVGKMGSNVVKALKNKVKQIILIDISKKNIEAVKNEIGPCAAVLSDCIFSRNNVHAFRKTIKDAHLAVCATSALRNIIKLSDLPEGFIIIDDSRPEAIPRDPKKVRLILEGGLLKLRGAIADYDYGYGATDDFFGCLGEAYVLAANKLTSVKPTIGPVDEENFSKFLSWCQLNQVCEGSLRSAEQEVTDDDIISSFRLRGLVSKRD